MTPDHLADEIAELALDKKAADVRVVDLRSVSAYTDLFVIATGGTDRQVKAIHDAVRQGLKDRHRRLPEREEGLPQATWVLLDYGDVVLHCFTPETRAFYKLEELWGDVPSRDVAPAAA